MEEGRSDSAGAGEGGGFPLTNLPENCVSAVIASMSPKDACRVATVSRFLKVVADSDAVWEKFLPSIYRRRAFRCRHWSSKKELYFSLCERPVFVGEWGSNVSLEKASGKWCCMLSARSLSITLGNEPDRWTWTSPPDFEPLEVAELLDASWLEIRGRIRTSRLSPNTLYQAYLVFKQTDGSRGFRGLPVEAEVGFVGREPATRLVSLHPRRVEGGWPWCPERRSDGWLEVELGEFFSNGDVEEKELQVSVLETKARKSGLMVQGIELRPKRVDENETIPGGRYSCFRS